MSFSAVSHWSCLTVPSRAFQIKLRISDFTTFFLWEKTILFIIISFFSKSCGFNISYVLRSCSCNCLTFWSFGVYCGRSLLFRYLLFSVSNFAIYICPTINLLCPFFRIDFLRKNFSLAFHSISNTYTK